MMMKRRQYLTAAILGAWTSVGVVCPVSAAETEYTAESAIHEDADGHALPETVVTADRANFSGGMIARKARMGILGDTDVMDIPYSMQSMTQKAIEAYSDAGQPLANVLLNDPSIRTSTSSPMYTDFSMRGINMNGNHFMLNGIPSLFYQFTTPPAHIIERMDITSGPNAAVNGVNMSNNGTNSGATPAPGTINVVTKRAAKEPVTKYTQTISGRGAAGEYIDIGRRFGKGEAWGLRVNAEMLDGGLSLPGSSIRSKNIFLNLDHRDARSATNLFFGYWDYEVLGAQRWFTYSGTKSSLPAAPSSCMNYDFPETWKWMYLQVLTLNHEQKIDDRWNVFFNAGYSKRDGDKMNSGANLQFDAAGNFTTNNRSNAQNEAGENSYLQLGVSGKLQTGNVKHNLVFSVDRSKAQYWNSNSYGAKNLYGGNLYDGIVFKPGFYPLPQLRPQVAQWSEVNVGISLMDTMSFGKWNVLLAASHKHEHLENYTNRTTIRNNNILPTWGVTYKPTNNVALYYGHTESFSRGYVVTNARYANVGAVMQPVRSKQNEIGVKYENKGMLMTLGLFQIDEANRFDHQDGGGKIWYVDDGRNVYQGIELTANGKLAPKWTITGGILYLDAQRDKTQSGAKDGWFVNGVAKWSSVLGLTYQADSRFSVLGRFVWLDKSYIDSGAVGGRTEIPSYNTLDLGMRYKTEIERVPVEFSLMCYNALNQDYWMGRGGSTTFGLSMPRTWMFSASASL